MSHKTINIFVRIVLVFILVLGTSSFISLCPFIYFYQTHQTNAEFYVEDVDVIYLNVYDFLVYQKNLSDDFTANEASHMRDVRVLFNLFRGLSLLFFILLVFYFFYLFKIEKNKILLNKFFKSMYVGCVISFSTLVFIVLFSSINFSASFDVFHRLFFPHGNWLFPSDSLLIILFPQDFFFIMAKKILLLSLSISFSLGIVFYYLFSLFKYK